MKILEELKTQLETKNLETVAQSMATLLDVFRKSCEESSGLLGPTIGQFIGFYSKAAGASAQAAVKIQGKIIRAPNWNAFPRPDRHFYTLDEVKTEVNTGDPVKIMEMLQVRRIPGPRTRQFLGRRAEESTTTCGGG